MYKVYCDSFLLYNDQIDSLKIFNPSLELELNKTGSFDFTIYPEHPYFGLIKKMKSIITVFQDDFQMFRGRVLDDEVGWHNERAIICEGDMAFLLDSVLRPWAFGGTPAEFLSYVLTLHNAQVDAEKQFQVGNVTVDGYLIVEETEYLNTFETVQKRLVEALGGYLMTRTEDGITYIDYLKEINLLSPQPIQFGKNLLDLKRIRKGADIVTVVIPLGAKVTDEEGNDTGKRLTIESANGGADFILDDAAISQYGTIVKSVIFEDITDAAKLMAAGQAYLNEFVNQWETIELTAADLATVDKDLASFRLGAQIRATSDPHGLNQLFLVSKLSINLLDPGANKMTLGKSIPVFSEAVKGLSDGQGLILQTVEKNAQMASDAVYAVEQRLMASIKATETEIKSSVSEEYYLKTDGESLGTQISSLSTSLSQTSQAFEMRFDGVEKDVITMQSYIRYEDGNIILGEEGNELTLKIEKDKITFLDGFQEVAYFSNNKLHVTDGEFLNVLRIGDFALYPRENGNLSFSKFN